MYIHNRACAAKQKEHRYNCRYTAERAAAKSSCKSMLLLRQVFPCISGVSATDIQGLFRFLGKISTNGREMVKSSIAWDSKLSLDLPWFCCENVK